MANRVAGNSTMNASFRILSICDDDGLRYSRELLLTNEGYCLESVTSEDALSVGRVRSFDAALICRSVDSKRGVAITEMLRRYNPEIQIMCIAPLETAEQFDLDLQIVSEPQLFLEAVRKLCQNAAARRAFQPAH